LKSVIETKNPDTCCNVRLSLVVIMRVRTQPMLLAYRCVAGWRLLVYSQSLFRLYV